LFALIEEKEKILDKSTHSEWAFNFIEIPELKTFISIRYDAANTEFLIFTP
jgi:hypothetical protein